jgi:hypothetical protein
MQADTATITTIESVYSLRFKEARLVGKGAFAHVYRVLDTTDNTVSAVKVVYSVFLLNKVRGREKE